MPLTRPNCVHILELCADVLCGCPTRLEFAVQLVLFPRSRAGMASSPSHVRRGSLQRERHRAACPRTSKLRSRAVPTERTLAPVCHETRVSIRCNATLRDMNIAVSADGLPMHHGAQLAVDATQSSIGVHWWLIPRKLGMGTDG